MIRPVAFRLNRKRELPMTPERVKEALTRTEKPRS